jgi:hypothetical protein
MATGNAPMVPNPIFAALSAQSKFWSSNMKDHENKSSDDFAELEKNNSG